MFFCDFETRSRVDLRVRGQSVYARDPSTEALCMAYAVDDGPVELWVAGEPCPASIGLAIDRGDTFHAHNAAFEIAIWTHVMHPRHGWPLPPLEFWRCTAARAATCALPRSLDGAAKALGLDAEKDKEGHRLMMKLAKPRKPTKHDKSEWHEKPDEFERLYAYCRQDVEVERAIHHATPPLPASEQAVWLLDRIINQRGVPVDLDLARGAIATHAAYQARLLQRLVELTDGEVTTARQQKRLVDWLAGQSVNVANVTAATVKEALADDSIQGRAREVLEIRRELSRSSVSKFEALVKRADEESPDCGRVRECHLYNGAERTGRFAGRGVQPQNIPSISVSTHGDGDPESLRLHNADVETARRVVLSESPDLVELLYGGLPDTLVGLIRPTIAAPPGHRLLVSDFAGIENRVLAWHAGERRVLDQIAQKRDPYKELASRVYDVPVADITKAQRHVGKIAVLGLGYGMGKKKFRETLAADKRNPMQVDEAFAGRVVDVYRQTHAKIVAWWKELNVAAIDAVATGRPQSAGRVRFAMQDDWLTIRLPSGRKLFYREPEVNTEPSPWGPRPSLSYMGTNSYTKKWERLRTYGGKLAENVVQATSRCLLVEAMQRVEEAGYPIVLHVHDEIVSLVRRGWGSIRAMERIMAAVPAWAEGCPIAAEGISTPRYRKF